MGIGIALLIVVAPLTYYRMNYRTHKRLRVVTEGKVYRSGCMTAEGFREAIQRHGIRTVINLQDEAPDPDLDNSYFSLSTTRESALCKEMGVRFIYLPVDLVHPSEAPGKHPAVIDRFLELLDDETIYPILVHCRAGLHRTGCLMALYRMEYEGWSKEEALSELKAHGFGEFASSAANDYITQFILAYQPRTAAAASAPSRQHSVPVVPVSRSADGFRPLPKGD